MVTNQRYLDTGTTCNFLLTFGEMPWPPFRVQLAKTEFLFSESKRQQT